MRNSVCSTSTHSHPVLILCTDRCSIWALTGKECKGCGQLIVDAIIGPYPFDQSASSSPSCTDGQWNFSEWRRPKATMIKQDAEDPWAQTSPVQSQVKINEELNICR